MNRFEDEICVLTGSQYAVACINGTAALHMALKAVGTKPDDEIIVPTVTFIAPINAVSYIGAKPVFMDCDRFYNLDAAKTLDFIETKTVFKDGHTYNKKTGRKIIAVIVVHVFGSAVDLEPLADVCNDRNIKVIEDAAESLGTHYIVGELAGRHTGTVGDIGCYSFNGNKIITTGGGGMAVTDNNEYAEKIRYLSMQAKDDPVGYVHNEVGYNYRLPNIQAALGVAQLEHLAEYIDTKKSNYDLYKAGIAEIPGLDITAVPPYANNNHWMYALQVDKAKYGKDIGQLMSYLSQAGIQTRPLWYLNHMQKPYRDCQSYKIQHAVKLLDNTLCIPCSVSLTPEEINSVVRHLSEFASDNESKSFDYSTAS